MSFGDISKYSLIIAQWMLSRGIKKGDCFAIWMGNAPEFVLFTAASLRIGTVMVPISVHESVQSVRQICEDCQCAFLVYDSSNKAVASFLEEDSSVPPCSVDIGTASTSIRLGFLQNENCPPIFDSGCTLESSDTIIISFSSGSTGEKKGIKKSLCSYFGKNGFSGFYKALLSVVHLVYPIRLYSLFPWYHNTGISLLLIALLGGRFQEITCDRYHPLQTLAGLKTHRPNIWAGTATMLYRCCLLEEAAELQLPSVLVSTGEALPLYIIMELEKHSNGGILYSGYGSTEVGNVSQIIFRLKRPPLGLRIIALILKLTGLFKKIYRIDELPEDDGISVLGNLNPSVQAMIFDEGSKQALPEGQLGEICIHTAMAMTGYLNEENSSIYLQYGGKQYLRTGDLGYLKDDLLFMAGRKKNLIIRSGEKILPWQVEQAAYTYPGVIAAIVCGIPSKLHGEDVCLCLQIDPRHFSAEQLPGHLRKLLPNYACPRYILYWEEFPMNASGKTDLKRIKAEAYSRIKSNNITS